MVCGHLILYAVV